MRHEVRPRIQSREAAEAFPGAGGDHLVVRVDGVQPIADEAGEARG